LDIFSSGAGIASTFSCSWIPSNYFSSWPPFSRSLWYIWLYILLLNYSTFNVLWFLSMYFLFLSYSIGLCFCLFILARYLYTCWTTTNEIYKILLISFQLVPYNFFISSMLNQILLKLLCKIFLYNLLPFLRFCLKILHLVLCRHHHVIL
jgi:hypothetical protein